MGGETKHLLISGRVQGVSYRAWLQREAQKLDITGWVRNRNDGTVEAVLQGTAENIDTLIERAHKGPLLAKVQAVEVNARSSGENFTVFEIKATK